MKIPKSFDLMGTKWLVKMQAPEDEGRLGCTIFRTQTILLDPKNTVDGIEATFLHELLHVIVYLMGIDKAMRLDMEGEEILVNAMSNGLYAALAGGILG